MNLLTVIFALLASLMYGLLNYYIGSKGYRLFEKLFPFINNKFYWIFFWLIVFSFIISRIFSRYLPDKLNYIISIVGYYWMVVFEYLLIILVILNLITFVTKFAYPAFNRFIEKDNIYTLGSLLIIISILIIMIYGTINARHPVVKTYNITINKNTKSLKTLNIVFASDLHIGQIVNKSRISPMITAMNNLKPDIILFGGDIIDDDPAPFIKNQIGELFKGLKSKYGTYAVLGNHEYYYGKTDTITKSLDNSHVIVLRDTAVNIDNEFYIVGREDKDSTRMGIKRKDFASLTKDTNKNLPIIVLDHQPPKKLTEILGQVDLELSGHTHQGQYFPNNLLTHLLFATDYGHISKDDTHLIVSSGYGTWGPPIRVGNKPEIVQIIVNFKHN